VTWKPFVASEQSWVNLQPIFLKTLPGESVVERQLPLLPSDKLQIPEKPGDRQGQEWWHFQMSDIIGEWYGMMASIGWTKEGLQTGPWPELYGQTGLGHKP
jgi:hypothetical protein